MANKLNQAMSKGKLMGPLDRFCDGGLYLFCKKNSGKPLEETDSPI